MKKYILQQETDPDTKNQRRMTEEERGEEIPSYRDAVAGEGQNTSNQARETRKPGPILGARWQAGNRSKCLPCAMEKPRFIISMNKLERYRSYMKDHALIYKFIGVWLTEKGLTK